jgi:hypothetical protein
MAIAAVVLQTLKTGVTIINLRDDVSSSILKLSVTGQYILGKFILIDCS